MNQNDAEFAHIDLTFTQVLSALDRQARRKNTSCIWRDLPDYVSPLPDASADQLMGYVRYCGSAGLLSHYRETEEGFSFQDLSEMAISRLYAKPSLLPYKLTPLLYFVAAWLLLNLLKL